MEAGTSRRGVSGGRSQALARAGTSSQYQALLPASFSGTNMLGFSLCRSTPARDTCSPHAPRLVQHLPENSRSHTMLEHLSVPCHSTQAGS